jgi:hypothetical protein
MSATQPDDRLPAALEAAALIRRAEAGGDFAVIVRKGDPDRGTLLLLVSSRGQHRACLERTLGADGRYGWQAAGPGDSASSLELGEFVAKRARFDPDSWVIELDIAAAERFIAETIVEG